MKKYTLAIIIIVIFVGFIGFAIYAKQHQPEDPRIKMTSRELAGTCTTEMSTVFHIHQHLIMIINKHIIIIPAQTGIDAANNCMRPIHIHDDNGIVHVESPVQKDFYLGDTFSVWGQTFNKNQIMENKVDATHGLKMYVNGKESTDFDNLKLEDKQEIVIDYYNTADGPDQLPPPYDWNNPGQPGTQMQMPTQAAKPLA